MDLYKSQVIYTITPVTSRKNSKK